MDVALHRNLQQKAKYLFILKKNQSISQQNTDAAQLMVTLRQLNLHICAATWGREKAGTRNNQLHQNNIKRMAMELVANMCIGGPRPSNHFLCNVYHHQH